MQICASIMEETVEGFLGAVASAKEADLVEIRADGLAKQTRGEVERLLRSVKGLVGMPLILTNRTKKEGGNFKGSEKERIEVLLRCMSLADFVDIEYNTDGRLRSSAIQEAKDEGVTLIISYHDFASTPADKEMLDILKKESALGADIAKLAVTANSMEDVLRLLEVTRKASEKSRVCTIAMGELGRISRIMAPFFGSEITYASVGKATAPGQLTVKEVKGMLEALK
ncbi:MAG: type I 3-dehydroquinate dehydratase [Candidatus Hydrothermarchaeales archaeon]